ncbi:MAG: hypothetical protein ACJ74W_08700 [Pyrinomonadaceae bacterium]
MNRFEWHRLLSKEVIGCTIGALAVWAFFSIFQGPWRALILLLWLLTSSIVGSAVIVFGVIAPLGIAIGAWSNWRRRDDVLDFYRKYQRLGPFEKFGVWGSTASIVGLLITLSPAWQQSVPNDMLVQTGTIQVNANVDESTVDVYFPIPYETPPELKWVNMPFEYRMLEQRADGFKVKFNGGGRVGLPEWQAKGLRKMR